VSHHEDKNPQTSVYLRVPAPEGRSGQGIDGDTTASFSAEFGAALAAIDAGVTSEETEAIAALPAGSALLIVRRGPNAGARFLLDADVTTVGRHPDADIFLDDVTVSRRHAEFVRHEGKLEIRDLNSLNGTYYDGKRIDSAILVDGGEVQVGKFRLTYYPSRLDVIKSDAIKSDTTHSSDA